MTREGKFPGGTLEVTLDVNHGIIDNFRIYGDFFGTKDVEQLENLIRGTQHQEESILSVLKNIDLSEYMVNIMVSDLLSLMF